jgi:hypothetical protein
MPRKLGLAFLLMAILALAGLSQAQVKPYRVEYFSDANTSGAPGATLRVDNNGAAKVSLCADIFVFDTNEAMSECCACLETPDGLSALSVKNDLTSDPLTGIILTEGLIMLVAAAPTESVCPYRTKIAQSPNAEIQAWATHIQSNFAPRIVFEAPDDDRRRGSKL